MGRIIILSLLAILSFSLPISSDEETTSHLLAPIMIPAEIETMNTTVDLLERWERVQQSLCHSTPLKEERREFIITKTLPC